MWNFNSDSKAVKYENKLDLKLCAQECKLLKEKARDVGGEIACINEYN